MNKQEYIYLLNTRGITMSMYYECFLDKNPNIYITLQEYQKRLQKRFLNIRAMPRGEEKINIFNTSVQRYLDNKFLVNRVFDKEDKLLLTY